jgi:hypothetical protein
MRALSFLICFVTFILSCKPGNADQENTSGMPSDLQALENQVMAVHDEVMPKMKDINDLSAKLRAIKANVKENDYGRKESPSGLEEVQGTLKLAEQGMWDWMKSFSDTKATLQEDQLKGFYEKELEKITKVKQDMLSAIEKAQTWLATNSN